MHVFFQGNLKWGILTVCLVAGIKNPLTVFMELLKRDETRIPEATITERTKGMIGRQHKNRGIRAAKNLISHPTATTNLKQSTTV
jgi:hypothetical protein